MQEFEVIVTNEILGNSNHLMTLDKIKKFNICAYLLAKKVLEDGKEHSMGMWTVRPPTARTESFIASERRSEEKEK